MSSTPTAANPAIGSDHRTRSSWRPAGRAVALVIVAIVAIGAAACSSGSGSGTTTSSTTSHTNTNGSTIHTMQISSIGTTLVNSAGLTLYHNIDDKLPTSSACTSSCLSAWPPLTVSAGTTPTLASGMAGTIGTVQRPEGTTQVTYNGEPLYHYSGDTSPGQATGQGLGSVWFAVTQAASAGSGGGSSTTTTPTTSGSGYSY